MNAGMPERPDPYYLLEANGSRCNSFTQRRAIHKPNRVERRSYSRSTAGQLTRHACTIVNSRVATISGRSRRGSVEPVQGWASGKDSLPSVLSDA
jgi:hypothetical protein